MYVSCWTFLCFPSPEHVEEKSLKLPYQVCHGFDGRHPTLQGAIRPKPRRTNSRLPFLTVLRVGLFAEHSMTYMYLACWTFLCFPSPGHVEEKALKLPYQVCHGFDGRHPTFQGKPRRTNSRMRLLHCPQCRALCRALHI